jgi:hypothetical protein
MRLKVKGVTLNIVAQQELTDLEVDGSHGAGPFLFPGLALAPSVFGGEGLYYPLQVHTQLEKLFLLQPYQTLGCPSLQGQTKGTVSWLAEGLG